MLVAAPPQLTPAKLVQYNKGRSSRRLQEEFSHLRKRCWGQHLRARGYFCATVGAVDEKTIMNTSRIKSGTKMIKDSKSQRPRGLEPACGRENFRRLQPHDNLPPFRR